MFPIFAGNSASTGYNLTRSLRTRASASAYLNRTPATTTNQKTWTWSGWVKRGTLGQSAGSSPYFFASSSAGTDATFFACGFNGDALTVTGYLTNYLTTTAVYRDPSAWYHIVIAVDTTQATTANRIKLYVNGSQVTAFSTANYVIQNFNTPVNLNQAHYLCAFNIGVGATNFNDLYLAEVNFVDGLQLTPSSFGSTNALTGVWQVARYSGSYGTNGFYLPFTDNSALTTASNVGLGKDFSGNGNYWATNNISITAGVTYDSMTDVPTLTSATAANFAVLNPIGGAGASLGIKSGNLQYDYAANSNVNGFATVYMPSSKWYIECIQTGGASADVVLGFATAAFGQPASASMPTDTGYFGYTYAGRSWNFGTNTNGNPTLTVTTDVMNFAIDITSGKAWVGKNGTWFGSGNPATGANPWWTFTANTAYTFAMAVYNAAGAINFGQRPFSYTPPSGFLSLNTFNLPDSTIVKGNTVMDATLWTGNGASPRTVVSSLNFDSDFIWVKSRSNSGWWHQLANKVAGIGNILNSNNTGAELAQGSNVAGYISSTNATGFAVTAGSSSIGSYNANGDTYVAWAWKAGSSSSPNTSGSITSTVSVNASAGFSVATFSGASGGTVGHGLGVAPQMIFIKSRTTATGWYVYTSTIGANGWLVLETNAAAVTGNSAAFGGTPTSTVWTYGAGLAGTGNYVAYAWTPIAGYSAFGSYTGNGSTDGPFVYTGFRPKFVMIKSTSTGGWVMLDTARDTYNIVGNYLYANSAAAEATASNVLDINSNGFKIRNTWTDINGSGTSYVYAAFAETPFKNSLAR